MFEPYLKTLAVQQPYLENWFGLDFAPVDTMSTGHWYLNFPDGSRYLFSVSLEAIKQALNGEAHAHVLFVAGGTVAVGGFTFTASDFFRAQSLEQTVRNQPIYEQATLEAGRSQAVAEGTPSPWLYRRHQLITGAWRQHLNCIWLGMSKGKVEKIIIG